QESNLQALELPNLSCQPLIVDSGVAKFDLTMFIEDGPQGLTGTLEYNTDLFQAETINRMLGHFQTLLTSIAADPEQRLSELQLLTNAEQHQLLVEWNNTQADYPKEVCIHQLFEEQVQNTPDAVAVVFENQQLTYEQLNQQANQLAHHLQNLGVKPEVLVGICLERSLEMVIGLLAILKAGGAYVPLDPAYPQERLALMLSDSQASVLLTQQKLLDRLPDYQGQILCIDTNWPVTSQNNPPSTTKPNNLAYVIYTSGSTGKPKGVQIPHSTLVNFLKSMEQQPGLTASDTLLAVTSISFDIAALELYLPLITGARLVLVSREVASDGKQLIEQLNSSDATVMQATPATWHMLLVAGWQGNPQLKILCGGEALATDLAEQLLSKGNALWNLYGPTETTIWSAAYQVEESQLAQTSVPIGRPIANTQIYLLDSFAQPVPVGIAGELHIGGDGLARGYLHRPELTDEKFITNASGERLYKTGDLARYLPDGTIEYLGRIDHQVKLRGFRIELGEIETVLRQHRALQQAVVIAREDEPDNQRLVAYVVGQVGEGEITSQLRSFLGSKLPKYMIPSAFVLLEALPLTPNGKIDRRALPVPETVQHVSETSFVEPRSFVEEMLAGIWAEVLGIKQVGIYDNFFELGGHSLLATQVVSRLEKAFQLELPLRHLFESPTLAELAIVIEETMKVEQKQPLPPIKPVSRNGQLPLSFAQQRLWFLEQLHSRSLAYNSPIALRLTGLLNVAALERTFKEIVARHEVLRTTFPVVEGRPIQLIAPSLDIKLPVVNLDKLPEATQSAEVQRLVDNWSQELFDLAQGPLLRVMLLRLAEQQNLLLLNIHHIVSDGWSWGVFLTELATLYESFSQAQPSSLPELPIQYADFAVWQREWLQGEVLEDQLAYWKQKLGTNPAVLDLPTDRSTSVATFQGAKHFFNLSTTLTEKIKTLSQQEGVTLFMTLLGAFKTLLHSYNSQEDILIGSPIANRNRTETERLIGFFVNTLVLRTDLSGNPSFRGILKRVREVTLGAYAHQDLPFEKLVVDLQSERNLNNNPLFRAWFVLQNAPTPALEIRNLTLGLELIETGAVRHDLKLDLTETSEGFKGFFEYKSDLFAASTISQMAELFEAVLTKIIQNPDIKLGTIKAILIEKQKQNQLYHAKDFKAARIQKLRKINRRVISE
ncbi:MAG: amino acid adenylation domain-containing protein, partial [Coleofasciculaceae cyanobacterium]